MSGPKHELTCFCARIERRCARMNSGLAAIAAVLAATTFFMSVVRISEGIARDPQLGRLPFIEMSTDGPDTAWMTD